MGLTPDGKLFRSCHQVLTIISSVKEELGLVKKTATTSTNVSATIFVSEAEKSEWKELKDSSLVVKKFIAHKEGEKHVIGKAVCIVDCSCEEALAWSWDYCSFERNEIYERSLGGET